MILYSKTPSKKFAPVLIFIRSSHVPISQKSSRNSNNLISFYSNLIDYSRSIKCLNFAKLIHAQLIKVGISHSTFLGNRLLELYSRFGNIDFALQLFDEMPYKNSYTWNILLLGLFKSGYFKNARYLFDEMPEPDIVSWNSMISGYTSNGLIGNAMEVIQQMLSVNVRPSAYTYSILMSYVSSASRGKQIHGCIIRSGLSLSNVVLGNCLINMYGRLRLVDYAFAVFLNMEQVDATSWNSLILGCDKSGYGDLALVQFHLMRFSGYSPDHFTISTIISICCNLQALEKGKHIFSLSVVMGLLSNSIVLSAIIDMFSKCDRLDDSVKLFEEMHRWDSAICNSMISGYSRHGFHERAMQLFMLTLRENLMPTEFTLSNILTSASCFFPAEQGIQIHPFVIKLGFESYTIVASSLIDMYSKSGLIESASRIFAKMGIRDLVSWNTMISGFARNGRSLEALEIFEQLLERGPLPDRTTFTGVLMACCHGGLVNEGMSIFSSMEEKYRAIPSIDHYTYIVGMMCQMGNLSKALEIIETMPQEPDSLVWRLFLNACDNQGDLKLTEKVAERAIEMDPHFPFPYYVLSQTYGIMGRWESLARVRKLMKDRGVRRQVRECCWIGIKNQVVTFEGKQILHFGGEMIDSVLRLLIWEMGNEGRLNYLTSNGYVCK